MDNQMLAIPTGVFKLGKKAQFLAAHLLAEGKQGKDVIGFGISYRGMLSRKEVARLTAKVSRATSELAQAEGYAAQIGQ